MGRREERGNSKGWMTSGNSVHKDKTFSPDTAAVPGISGLEYVKTVEITISFSFPNKTFVFLPGKRTVFNNPESSSTNVDAKTAESASQTQLKRFMARTFSRLPTIDQCNRSTCLLIHTVR